MISNIDLEELTDKYETMGEKYHTTKKVTQISSTILYLLLSFNDGTMVMLILSLVIILSMTLAELLD